MKIRVGIGGWTYEPWRGVFYPKGLPHKRELAHAASRLTTIELNATFFRSQTRASFARWRDETPDDFVFAIKASRFCVTRKDLTTAGSSIEQFFAQGLDVLGKKLGPILWQLAPTKQLSIDELDGFLSLLPRGYQHALEPRHTSFAHRDTVKLAKQHDVALVRTDSLEFPTFDAHTSTFTYARLVRAEKRRKTGYSSDALGKIAVDAQAWAKRGTAYVFFINGAKERAPAAAEALLARLA